MGINRSLDQGMFCFRSPKKNLKLDLTEPQKNSNPKSVMPAINPLLLCCNLKNDDF